MGIALDIFRQLQYEKGYKDGYEIGYKMGYAEGRKEAYELSVKLGLAQFRAENRVELDYLRKRLAELERINGISPDESHASGEGGSRE